MTNPTEVRLPKWPFFAGDAVLLGLVYFVYLRVRLPLGHWEAVSFIVAGIVGAVLAAIPYLLEYRAAVRMLEAGAVASTVSQIQDLEQLAGQIAAATSQWQGVHEHSTGAVDAAKEIAAKMADEKKAFAEFMKKATDSERATLRLEVEKLRRQEGEWLQVAVRLLDHTYALYQAAMRSGQANVIEQITQFQNVCRDVVRRIGLVPFAAAADEAFDPEWHHSTDSQTVSMADAKVRETIATGYTYQGQKVRPALVSLQNPPPAGTSKAETPSEKQAAEKTPAAAKPAEEPLEEQTLL